MAKTDYDIVAIGGGSAGLVVAVGAAQLGARVALVEKCALGGDCLFTGCVPSKTLIRSARFAADARRAADFGFSSPHLEFKNGSFSDITARVQRVIKKIGEHDAPERFRALGVDVIFGTPRFISRHELEVTQSKHPNGNADASKRIIRAHRFCISTGSRPAIPPIPGLNQTGFLTNEEVFHAQKLPRSLVVLGAGPVGLELGQCFARFGSEVTVVEMGGRVLPREDEEVSAKMKELLEAERMRLLLNTTAVRARVANGNKVVTVERDQQLQEIHAEEILVATGRRPNIEGMNLEAAGVQYDKQRIITDQYLHTTQSNIYAAGDVTGHFPFTHMAAYEASVVVRNALFFGPLRQRTDFRLVPWTTFTDPEVARVGLTENEASERFGAERTQVFRVEFAENDRANTEEETCGFVKIICDRRGAILGAHIVGAHAGELIHEIVLAMRHRLPISSIGGLVHVYPTFMQVNQRAGLNALKTKLTPTVKKVLSYYFSWWRS